MTDPRESKANAAEAFKPGRTAIWTRERLARLDRQELLHLQANAARLGEAELAQLCGEILKDLPRRGPLSSGAAAHRNAGSRLIPRTRAFQLRGVWLQDPRTSWSGVRKSDGGVIFALWMQSIQTGEGSCRCLLWSPNTDGALSWSDSEAGQERREHCVSAMARGSAEGILVHGEALEGRLPEDRARTVLGVDPETIIQLRVEQRGHEYWAVWGIAADRDPSASHGSKRVNFIRGQDRSP